MPIGPKLVITLQALFVLLAVASLDSAFIYHGSRSIQVARLVVLTVQVALLVGLYARHRSAWYVARWLAGIWTVVGGCGLLWQSIYLLVCASDLGASVLKLPEFDGFFLERSYFGFDYDLFFPPRSFRFENLFEWFVEA